VLVLSLVLVLVVAVASASVAVAAAAVVVVVAPAIFLSLVVAKNRQIGGVFTFSLVTLEQKTQYIPMFFAPPKPKTTVFSMFFLPLVAKTTVFTVFFGQRLAKTFLGFMLETKPLELIYQGPTNVSQVLSPFSASPPKVLLSGFRYRCHIVVKGAFPEFRVRKGIDQLIQLYTLAGFPNEELHQISTQILTQHQNLQTPEQKPFVHSVSFESLPLPFM
jgi:hypothetical protein